MDSYPALNLPPVRLRGRRRDGGEYVWDALRGCWLKLTPEEWVRRHVVGWLMDRMKVQPTGIVQEFPVSLGGSVQRADIVVVTPSGTPVMLVECKAASVTVDASVLDQAMRYNSVVGARYIMITNGLKHYFLVTWNGVDYSRLDSLPSPTDLLL